MMRAGFHGLLETAARTQAVFWTPMAATKERIAYHEAGHTVAALCFSLPILSVSLDPPRLLRERLRAPEAAHLCVCFSGGAAERLARSAHAAISGDYAQARRFLSLRYSLVEIGARSHGLRHHRRRRSGGDGLGESKGAADRGGVA
jgi:hypothetical protein